MARLRSTAGAVAAALSDELRLLASWLGLGRVTVGRRGDLTPAAARGEAFINEARHEAGPLARR